MTRILTQQVIGDELISFGRSPDDCTRCLQQRTGEFTHKENSLSGL